jgi:hypothetical protein
MPRVRFTASTLFEGVSYAQNQVVDLPKDAVKALGDSVEQADDRDIDAETRDLSEGDPDRRAERDVHREPGDAQDIPDAVRDNDSEDTHEAKALGQAPHDKMLRKPTVKK